MLSSRRFLLGFLLAGFLFGGPLIAMQYLLRKAGEIDLEHVISRQLGRDNALYSSGLNQQSYTYKLRLMRRVNPEIIAIGSSRAMPLRGVLFKSSFTNLGGAVNGVSELEEIVAKLEEAKPSPRLAFVFVDPWWFNRAYAGNGGVRPVETSSESISIALVVAAVNSLAKGNWISELFDSENLGIHAILTREGFASDGSYHYTQAISRKEGSHDYQFGDTLARIRAGGARFEKTTHPDVNLLQRSCKALTRLQKKVGHVVVVSPPFAPAVYKAIKKGGYEYIAEANDFLANCVAGGFFDFTNGDSISQSTDCEYVDGMHGGDVAYARMAISIANLDPFADTFLNRKEVVSFVTRNAGFSGGETREKFLEGMESDHLGIGCVKGSAH